MSFEYLYTVELR